MRSLGAPSIQHKLVLRIADIDASIVVRAGVGARVRADWVITSPLVLTSLLALAGLAEAVRQVIGLGVLANLVGTARADLLNKRLVSTQVWLGVGDEMILTEVERGDTHDPLARDIALLDAHAIVGAGILAELALIVTAG